MPSFVEATGTDAPQVATSADYPEILGEKTISMVLPASGSLEDRSQLEQQINDAISNPLLDVAITTRIRLNDLATKIMVLNLIEDNFG